MEYNYSFMIGLERDFEVNPGTVFIQNHWDYSIFTSIVYVLVVKIFPGLIKQEWNLERALCCWNISLALFSMIGFFRMIPELYFQVTVNGFIYSICDNAYATNPPSAYWTHLFIWSKPVELIDTLFLILRKKPVIFLHWYHHISVFVYTWHATKDHTAAGRWFVTLNYGVHALMYSYFALKAYLSFSKRTLRIPKWIPMLITSAQLGQMVMGCIICASVWKEKLAGRDCTQTWENVYLATALYSSYAILFAHFFRKAYFSARPTTSQKQKSS